MEHTTFQALNSLFRTAEEGDLGITKVALSSATSKLIR